MPAASESSPDEKVGGTAVEGADLRAAIIRVLAQHPGSTARAILAGLPDDLRPHVIRRDVNSILYRGAGKEFIRSDDAKPQWRLRDAAPDVEDIARILFDG